MKLNRRGPNRTFLLAFAVLATVVLAAYTAIGEPDRLSFFSNAITVQSTPANEAPVIDQGTTASLACVEDGPAQALLLSATDAEGDALVWSVAGGSLGAATVEGGSVTYTPAPDAFGEDTLTVTVHDAQGGGDATTVTVTIAPVNDPPTLPELDAVAVAEDAQAQTVPAWAQGTPGPENESGQTLTYTVESNDNSSLFAQGGLPAISQDGTLTFAPAPNANGVANLTVMAVDNGEGLLATPVRSVSITVAAANDAPINDAPPSVSGTCAEGETLSAAAGVWNDDADGNQSTLQTGLRWQSAADASGADIAQPGTGSTLTLTAAQRHRYIRVVETVTDTDASGTQTAEAASAWQQVQNAQPVIAEETVAILTDEDTAGTATLHAADADGDTLTWQVSAPASGTATVDEGTITYTPAADAFGTDSFTVTVSDAYGGTASRTVAVTVAPVNDPPTFAVGESQSVAEDAPAQRVPGWIAAVSAGPENEQTQTVDFEITGNDNPALFASGGLPAVSRAGELTYAPESDANGQATLTLIARDGGGAVAAAQTFTITVAAVNDPPVNTAAPQVNGTFASEGQLTATPGEWSDAADGDAGRLTYTWAWQSALDESGTDLQPFGTGDGQTLAAAQSHRYVRVQVTATDTDASGTASAQAYSDWHFVANTAPAITETQATLQTDEDTAGTLTLHATDADGDTLAWRVSQPAKGTAAVAGGTLTYTPDLDTNGADSFTVTVDDSHGGEATLAVDVAVAAVNDTPTFTAGDSQAVLEDAHAQTVPAWVAASAAGPADEAGQTVDFVVTGNTKTALFTQDGMPTISQAGTLTYTLAPDMNGVATVTVVAHDSGGGANTTEAQSFTITVTPVNDAPSFVKGAEQAVAEDCGAVAVAGWASALSAGPADEALQTLAFHVACDNTALFTAGGQPALSPAGKLTYTPAPDANGNTTVTVTLADNGGTLVSGDVDTSPAQTFVIDVAPVNDTPRFTKGADQTVAEDAGAQAVPGWATGISAGAENETLQALSFDVTANTNTALFAPDGQPAVSPEGKLTYTPAPDANGEATLTLRLRDDGDGANASATQSFTIRVTAVNDVPVITGDAAFATDEDTAYTYHFAVADVEDAATALTVACNTGSTAMLKKANMTLGGSGADRTLTVLPEADRSGDVAISLTVIDGQGGVTVKTITMTVMPVNDAPTISTLPDRATDEDTATGAIGFTIGDIDTDPAACTVAAISANEALVPNDPAHTQTGGSGQSRTLTLTPAENQYGSTQITVTVSDGALEAQASFTLTVNPIDDAPTISAIADLHIDEDGVAQAIAFTLADVDNDVSKLTVSAATANTAMIPRANIVLAPIAADGSCALRVTPVANINGAANMTVTVKDPDGKLGNETFVLTVDPVNDAPVLAAIGEQTTNEDTAKTITVSVSDIDNDADQLTLTATGTGNAALLPLSGVAVAAGGDVTRSVKLTPAADQNGTTTVTLTLADGAGGIATRTFTFTVKAINDKPAFTRGANVNVPEDSGAYAAAGWATGITTGAANEDQSLTFVLTTDNNALFAQAPAIDPLTGALTFAPAPDACGVANVTATLSDSGEASADPVAFTITLAPVNDAPVANGFATAINTDEDQQVSGSLKATDVDGDTLTYELAGEAHGITSLDTAHGHVTLDAASGTFVYVPAKDHYDGADTFDYRVFDGALYSQLAQASIDFSGVNDAPVALDGTIAVDEDVPGYAGTLATLASDVDSSTLTYAIALQPDRGGSLTLNETDGSYTYTPAPNYFGTERFTYSVTDGVLTSETATVIATVAAVNDAPVAQSETIFVDEGQSLTGLLKAVDVEEDAVTYAVLTSPLPDGMAFAGEATGLFTYAAPFVADAADHEFKVAFSATDALGAATQGEITIRVRNVNRAPARAGGSPAVFAAQEDVAKAFYLGVTDPDGDALTYTLLSHVSHGTFTGSNADGTIGADGSFTYQSAGNYSGTDRFTFMASDAAGLKSAIYTALITVAGVNDVPEGYDQYFFTAKNTTLTGIQLVGYDADGDGLTYEVKSQPVKGTLTWAVNGQCTYQPATDVSGDFTFTFIAKDSHGGESAPATVHIHVYGDGGTGDYKWVNPIGPQVIDQNTVATVDVGTHNIVYGSVTLTSGNTWLLSGTDLGYTIGENTIRLTLKPKAYRTGQSVITLKVVDADGSTFIRTFVLTVTRINVAPVANDLARTIDQNSEMFEFVTGSDLNGDWLHFTLDTQPEHGDLTFNADGTFHYVPDTGFTGTDQFTFYAADSQTVSDSAATVTINVDPVPIAPTAEGQSIETQEDTAISGQLSGTEPHGKTLAYLLVQNGRLGSATVNDDGSFTYTPNANLYGQDSFTFKTKAASGLYSTVACVRVTILPVNDTPVLGQLTFTAYEDKAVSGYLKATDADLGDTLSYSLAAVEGDLALGTLTLDADTGRFTYTPHENVNGTDHFHVLVRDASASTEPVLLTVKIVPSNDAPRAVDTRITVDEDASVTGSIAPFYSDVDGDAQTLSVVQSPAKGKIVFAANGTYTYTPDANVNGVDYFTFRTRDSGGLSSNVALATVVINPVNDAPTLTAPDVWVIKEDSHDQIFRFTVADVEDSAGVLAVSGTYAAADLQSVTFWGTGSSRWMLVTPKDDFQSDTDIVITVADTGKDGTLSGDVQTASRTITVTVEPVNDTPTINGFESGVVKLHNTVTIYEDSHTEPIAFTVGDEEMAAEALNVTGDTGNATLLPASGIVIGGTGANRTVTATPAANRFGTVRVTVYASDGVSARTGYVDVVVEPVNDAPTVKPPAEQTIPEDSATEILYYSIADIDSAVSAITMSAASSDESIVAASGITLSGNGAERTVAVRPLPNAYGDVTIMLTADDQGKVDRYGSASFVVHVTPVNDAPAIAAISNYTIDEDSATGHIPVSLSDIDNDEGSLTLSGTSGNPALIDAGGIAFGTDAQTGARYVVLTPKPDQYGSAMITLKAADPDKRFSQRSFTLTVLPINDAPTITAIADQTILEDRATGLITFTVADIDNDVLALTVAGVSANGTVIPDAGIVVAGNGAERTVRVTPAADQNGDIQVTLTVTDPGKLTGTSAFTVRITPVNDIPAFTVGADQAVLEDCGTQTLPAYLTGITRGKPNEAAQRLTFYLSVDNAALFAADGQPAIDEAGQLTYTPAADQNGTASITLYAMDDGGTANGGVNTSITHTFAIAVAPVNDIPTFEDVGVLHANEDAQKATYAWIKPGTVSVGPANEAQTYSFILQSTQVSSFAGNTTASLFNVVPSINATTGAITFQPKANISGTATLAIVLKDNGDTQNGGVNTSQVHTCTIEIAPVNDAPVFTLITNPVTVSEDSGPYSAANAKAIGPGGASDEAAQPLTFTLTTNNDALFATLPAMTSAGLLTFTPAPDMYGSAMVTATLSDGLASTPKSFVITVNPVNDAPAFTAGESQTVLEDATAQAVAAWAGNLYKGPANESGQALTFVLTNDNTGLFATGGQPAVDADGRLTYTPAPDAFGIAHLTATLTDDGGVERLGENTSDTYPFTIEVLPVNDMPSFADSGNILVPEDAGPTSKAWVTAGSVSMGPANEASQGHTFSIEAQQVLSFTGSEALFAVAPAIDPATGALSFTPMAQASGVAEVSVRLTDDGGTDHEGVNATALRTITITVEAQNDLPTYTLGGNISVGEDSGAYSQPYATGIGPGGGDDEAAQSLAFTLSGYTASWFETAPTISKAGVLTFKPAKDANGTTTVTVSLSDGINAVSSTFQLEIWAVNDKPSFTVGANQAVLEDCGIKSITGWAKNLNRGAANESGQTLTFYVSNDNTGLFTSGGQPTVSSSGKLTYTPALNAFGTATVTLYLKDGGGVLKEGVDTSDTQTFTITVAPVNDQPSFSAGDQISVSEDSGAYSAPWALPETVSVGPANELQGYAYSIVDTTVLSVSGNSLLFATLPAIDKNTGAISFTPNQNANGVAEVYVVLKDDGLVANGGVDTSVPHKLTITVTAVDDPPAFTLPDAVAVLEDSGSYSAPCATGITTGGGDDERAQPLTFTLTGYDAALFETAPAIAANGTLTFTPAQDAYGTTVVDVSLSDGHSAVAGSFTIAIEAVNDAPSFTAGTDQATAEDSGPQQVEAWASEIAKGPANESEQTLAFDIVNDNAVLFTADGQPALTADGQLTYTPAPDAYGTATVTLSLRDDGGVANRGSNTSQAVSFVIDVLPVNDQPSFADSGDITVLEDHGAYDAPWAVAGSEYTGPDNEQQTYTYQLLYQREVQAYGAKRLFEVAPTVDPATGAIRFTPSAQANGYAEVAVVLYDDDGVDNGGADMSEPHIFTIHVTAVDDPPSFTLAGPVAADEDSPAYNQPYATRMFMGGGMDEQRQQLTFTLTGYDAALFAVAPALSASTGNLTFTPAKDAYGQTTVTATLNDGANDVSQTFTITLQPVNDQPSFSDWGNVDVLEDSGAYSAPWAIAETLRVGPDNETQGHAYQLTDTQVLSVQGNTELFAQWPAIDADTGALTFTPMENANGQASLTVLLADDGDELRGGVKTSVAHTFTLTVGEVNDLPTFATGGTVTVKEDSGAYSQPYATGITPGGGTDELAQPLAFTLTGYDAALFAATPALDAGGTLTFTPAKDANGETTVTATLTDGIDSVSKTFTIVVQAVNDAPTFAAGANQQALEDGGLQTVAAWATQISRGPADESGQTLAFQTSNDNTALFTKAGQPAIDAAGQLTYTPAPDAYGAAKVTVALADNGGTLLGGADTSQSITFTVNVLPVNDQPSFAERGAITVEEDSGAYSAPWALADGRFIGPGNEQQTYRYHIDGITTDSLAGNTRLFAAEPAIDPQTGAISFTPEANANGVASVTVYLSDDDGVANGGVDTSEAHVLVITVTPVNDLPTFKVGEDITVYEDGGLYQQAFASGITPGGGTDELGQTLAFTLAGHNTALFSGQPGITTGGVLAFTPAADANGTTTVTAKLSDNGGVSNAKAVDSKSVAPTKPSDSAGTVTDTFTIAVLPVNDAPSFTAGPDQRVYADAGAQSVGGWARNLSRGPGNESGQSLSFRVTNTNAALFTSGGQPAVSAGGTLTYTPAIGASGTATVTVTLSDSGGTDNGGRNTSAGQSFSISVLPADGRATTTLSVTLAWVDSDNSDGLRPDAATVYLYDGTGVIDRQVLNQSNGWAYTFTDLPMFDAAGTPIEYRVVEAAIEKYHFTYSYGQNSVHIDNIHIAEPFQLVSDSGFIQWLDYGVPLGANSNMNEGDCFN